MYTVINGEALEVMEKLAEKGFKADLILCDPPYGTTKNEWDKRIDSEKLWKVLKKIRKETTPIILFCVQPYTSELVTTNLKEFKYMKYWKKDRPGNFLNSNRQPLREIEEVAIFYKKQCFYNPQKILGKPNHSTGKAKGKIKKVNNNYGNFVQKENLDGFKYPKQLMEHKCPFPAVHGTEKPFDLMEDLVLTYSKEGDTILDFCMGSGTIGLVAKKNNRNYIGIEKDLEIYNQALDRIGVE